MVNANDLVTILPALIVAAWSIVLLVADLWIPAHRKGVTALLAATGMAVALGFALGLGGRGLVGFNGMVVMDGFAGFTSVLILGAGMIGVALAYDFLKRHDLQKGEYYVLLMFSITGMLLLVQAYDLIVVFLAVELLSIPLYVLAGFARPRVDSEESSLKYFLLGSLGGAFLLYGIAMTYGATARTDLPGILAAVQGAAYNPVFLMTGAALILVGFGFKVSAAPFHMWAPDVYQGAPTPVTSFMSVAVKASGVAALLRVFLIAFPSLAAQFAPALWVIAALTMVIGNVLAVVQTNIKRMLAYSSIANVGYLLMAFTAYGKPEVTGDMLAAALFFLASYALASFAAWAVVISVERQNGEGQNIDDFAGLGKKSPYLAAAMLIAMLSFAGMPITLGFWGKLFVFRSAVEAGLIGLALVGLLTSLFSAYYYLRVVVVMYMKPGDPEVQPDPWLRVVAVASALVVLLLSLVPGPLLDWAASAVLRLQ